MPVDQSREPNPPSQPDLSNLNINFDFLRNIQLTPEMVAFAKAAVNQLPLGMSGVEGQMSTGVQQRLGDQGSNLEYGFSARGQFQNSNLNAQHNPYIQYNQPLDIPVDNWIRRDAPSIATEQGHTNMRPGRTSVGAQFGPVMGEFSRGDKTQDSPTVDEMRLQLQQQINNGVLNAYLSRMRNGSFEGSPSTSRTEVGANYQFGSPSADSALFVNGNWSKDEGQKPQYGVQLNYQKRF